ncbi:MAG: thioredoxin family protein [Actinomycetota bacterium]
MGSIAEATRESFGELVAEGTVLVDVWGPQCRPCIALMPHVERIAAGYPDLTVVKLEAPKARRICIDLKVMSMPTFLLFRDGKEVSRITDPDLRPAQLEEWLEPLVGSAS